MTTAPAPPLRDLLPALVDELPQVIDEVVELLRVDWPDYAQTLVDDSAEIAGTAEAAIRHLVTLAERGVSENLGELRSDPTGLPLFEEVGRIEWREGRSLATLLSAYRAGAQVAWRHMSRAALRKKVRPESLALLAEAVFVFVDQLSDASARGYVEEQQATAAERERLRADVVELLLSERADLAVARISADAAGWPLPATASLVLVNANADNAHHVIGRLEPASLPVRRSAMLGAIVPDPDGPGRRSRLADAVRGVGAVIGPTVPPALLPTTLPIVAVAARLRDEGVLTADPTFVDEHYDAIVVHADPRLLGLLREQVLQPLADVPPATRGRLEETLAAWLLTMGNRQEVARMLHVHPQTVRYRIGRLRTLFGAALDEPATRLRLTLALCWRAGS